MQNKSHHYRSLLARATVGLLVCAGAACALAAPVWMPADPAPLPAPDSQATPQPMPQATTHPTAQAATQEAGTQNPSRKLRLAKARDELLPTKPQGPVRALKQN